MSAKRRSENMEKSSIEALEAKVTTLQTALDEAYDNIDELEFELESVSCWIVFKFTIIKQVIFSVLFS